MLTERDLLPEQTTGLVGLDQGQGSLKVALTLTENSSERKDVKRSSYSQVFNMIYITRFAFYY